MCLAVPGQIKEMCGKAEALVDFMGVSKKVALDLIKDPKVGDYVIVHAGFAINKLNEEEALETLKTFEELYRQAR